MVNMSGRCRRLFLICFVFVFKWLLKLKFLLNTIVKCLFHRTMCLHIYLNDVFVLNARCMVKFMAAGDLRPIAVHFVHVCFCFCFWFCAYTSHAGPPSASKVPLTCQSKCTFLCHAYS